MDEKKAKKLNTATKRLFNEIKPDDVLSFDKRSGVLTLGGKPLSREQSEVLIAEASTIKETQLWALLLKTMVQEACKRMYLDSLSFDDMVAGKWILYTIDIFDKKVQNLSKLE